MTHRPFSLAVLAATMAMPLSAAVPAARQAIPAVTGPLNAPRLIRQIATGVNAAQTERPAARAGTTLPPTAPTVLKSARAATSPTPSASLPAPRLLAQAQTGPIAQAAGQKPLSPAEIRAQAAPPDAAPLRPPSATAQTAPGRTPAAGPAQRPAVGKAATAVQKPAAPTPALQSTARTAAAARTAAPTSTPLPGAPPAAAAPASAAVPAPKVANLPPGPLTNLPVKITTSPNEVRITGLGSSSAPWSIVLLLTLLSVMPAILICVTPFARLLVVFHFLRQALGLQTTPSNQTLIGLTLILTFFIMEPVGKQVYEQSLVPLQNGQITAFEAIERTEAPMREFMVHFVREKDAALFLEIAKEPRPHDIHDLSMRVLLPAYIVSELKAGFQIGAVLFLPFLVVDMVVASITTSVGMMQLPPVVISTPLKLMLFLMVDGWHLLIGALVRSFN